MKNSILYYLVFICIGLTNVASPSYAELQLPTEQHGNGALLFKYLPLKTHHHWLSERSWSARAVETPRSR